jgi:hypothetical protein
VTSEILECGQPSKAVTHHWRKFCPLDINLIAQYDVYLTGKRTYDREFRVTTVRRYTPWLLPVFRRRQRYARDLAPFTTIDSNSV